MFGKLKDALKKSLSIFSKKAKEEAEPVEKEAKEELKEIKEEPEEVEEIKEKIEEIEEPVIKTEEKVEEKKKSSFLKRIFTFGKGEEEISEEKEQLEPIEVEFEQKEPPKPAEVKKEEIKPEPEEKKSIFAKAKELITTKKLSEEKFEEIFWDLELVMLENNVAVEVIQKIKQDLKEKLVDKSLPRDLDYVVETTLTKSLEAVLTSIEKPELLSKVRTKKPFVIAFFGINGSGKTTTIAKVASLLKKHGLTSVIAASDTFRAAAIQQLEEHASKLNTRLIKHDYGADAAAVAFDAVQFAQKNNIDAVLIDTAGRLHSDINLMDELKKIVRVAKPDLKIFVGESITGNDCIEQTNKFDEHIGIDAVILTKADVDEKGGTALSISFVTKKPIIYIGTGQQYADLQPFTKEIVLKNLGLLY